MIPALLAIDPGSERSGLAVLGVASAHREPLLVWSGHHDPKRSATTFTEIVRGIVADVAADGYEIHAAVIEDQFVRVNARSALTLARTAGRWVEACAVAGFAVELIPASQWQAAALARIVPTAGGRAKRPDLKAASVRHASRLWGVNLGPDEADAALMGRFVALRETWSRAVRGARRT